MNIILFTTVQGRPGSLNLSRPRFYLPVLAMIAMVCSLLFYTGYRVGGKDTGSVAETAVVASSDWRSDLDKQRQAIEQTRRTSRAHLDALALRVAQIQAQVMRLDGLGQRLVDLADLDEGEFNFGQPPAQGGPVEAADLETSYSEPVFMQELESLSAQLKDRERQMIVLEDLLQDRNMHTHSRPTGRPITDGWLSSNFGKRTDPFTGRTARHDGLDFAGKLGADIIAAASGVVTWSGQRSGYGNLVEINHGNGFATRYGHCQKNLVRVGQTVKRGQLIAKMGSTGRSTGPHVHFEVLRNGNPVNPSRYLTAAR